MSLEKIVKNYIITPLVGLSFLFCNIPYYNSNKNFIGPRVPTREEMLAFSHYNTGLIPDYLARFFERFDKDKNKILTIDEQKDFFYWVKKNIKYQIESIDYRQRPYETFNTRKGDCEDMATLEVAFYTYWNKDAYIASVNTRSEIPDHITAIVFAGKSIQNYILDNKGKLDWWKIDNFKSIKRFGVNRPKKGYYIVVDNAYSDDFGYISKYVESGSIPKGMFSIKFIGSLEEPYDLDYIAANNYAIKKTK